MQDTITSWTQLAPLMKKYIDKLEFIESPRYIFFGPKALDKTPLILKSLEIKGTILIITGGTNTSKIAGRLADRLDDEGWQYDIQKVATKMPKTKDIENLVEKGKNIHPEILIGVGGGRVLDVTKLTAAWLGLKYLSAPTSASHDGVASPCINFLLSRQIESTKGPEWAIAEAPFAIIADTEIIKNAPPETFKAGFGDLVSKITAVKDWELASKLRAERYSEYAASMAILSAKIVMDHASEVRPGFEESARIVVKALIGSGVAISIAGSSRPASGSEHLFSHALDILAEEKGYKNTHHGIQVALGTIMMADLQGQDWKKIREKLVEAGVPVTAEEAGLDREAVIEALTIAHKVRDRFTILGTIGLTETAARKLAERTGIISTI